MSIGIITGAVVLMLVSFSMQVLIVGVEQFVTRVLPQEYRALGVVVISRSVGVGAVPRNLYAVHSLTLSKYRRIKQCPKMAGRAVHHPLVDCRHLALPPLLASLMSHDATYGSLAGVMVALFFLPGRIGYGDGRGAQRRACTG